jgi:hypothetical protein
MPILLVTKHIWQLFFLYLRQTLIHCDDLLFSSRALPCHYGKATCAHNLCIPAVYQNLLGLLFNFFGRSEAAVSFFLDPAGLPAFHFSNYALSLPQINQYDIVNFVCSDQNRLCIIHFLDLAFHLISKHVAKPVVQQEDIHLSTSISFLSVERKACFA